MLRKNDIARFLTPALSHDQDLENASDQNLMSYWPTDHTGTGKGFQNLKRWGKSDVL